MSPQSERVEILIIGAGFGGVGVGITLLREGIEDFLMIEAEDDVGGTWRTNRYPGCACDVPSQLYSYSFELNPDWPQAFSEAADIERYIQHCVDKYQVREKIRFGTKVLKAEFRESEGLWHIQTDDGKEILARVFVPATGGLSQLRYPEIKGMNRFGGKAIHAAKWDPEVELEDQRVGVIGTGASSIQIVPSIAPKVKSLSVFQRSAAWVLPRWNRPFTPKEQMRWKKSPWRQRLRRWKVYWFMELALPALMWFPSLLALPEFFHTRRLKRAVKDPELRRKLTPTYRVGCKRALVSDVYFPAFARDNVELVTDGISEIVPEGVRTNDGRTVELDVIIYATGYAAGDPAYPFEVRGNREASLRDYWGDRKRAYYGMNVAGFPNMVMIMGPNTGPGHTSVLVYQEPQYAYVVKYYRYIQAHQLRSLDVKESVQESQFDAFQRRMRGSSWNAGCTSWYLNRDGTNSAIWPGFSFEYGLRIRRLDPSAYHQRSFEQSAPVASHEPQSDVA